jgi:hypothetical protein
VGRGRGIGCRVGAEIAFVEIIQDIVGVRIPRVVQRSETLVPGPGETADGRAFARACVRTAMTWDCRVGPGRQEPHRAHERGHNHPDGTETHGEHSGPSAHLDARTPGLADVLLGVRAPLRVRLERVRSNFELLPVSRQTAEPDVVMNRDSGVRAIRREPRLGFRELLVHLR